MEINNICGKEYGDSFFEVPYPKTAEYWIAGRIAAEGDDIFTCYIWDMLKKDEPDWLCIGRYKTFDGAKEALKQLRYTPWRYLWK